MSRPKPVIYQEQVQIQPGTTRVPNNPVDPKFNVTDPHGRIQVQQHVQDQGYLLQQQFDQQQQLQHQHQQQQQQLQQQQQHQQHQQHQQQQFMQGGHFVHHNPGIPQYYPVYPSQQQPQVYYLPARQAQAYNLSVQQANMGESAAAAIPSSRPQNPPNPATLVQPTAAYNPIRNAPLPKTEMTATAYRTAATGNPQFVQVPPSQHQQQYVTYSQIHHPSQSMAPNSAAPANYAYEYADPAHAQIYYSQPMAPTMPSQYQTMTAAGMVMPEASAQHPSDSMKQQIRTSQPL